MMQHHGSQYPHKCSIFRTSYLPLQKLKHEFKIVLGKAASVSQVEEEPRESVSTEPCAISPTRVLKSHWQHVADYVHLMIEEGEDLTMGEDWAAPLITEVFSFSYTCFSGFCFSKFLSLQFFSIYHLIFRPYRKFTSQTTSEVWQIYYMQMPCSS